MPRRNTHTPAWVTYIVQLPHDDISIFHSLTQFFLDLLICWLKLKNCGILWPLKKRFSVMIFPSHARAFLKSVFIIHQQQFFILFVVVITSTCVTIRCSHQLIKRHRFCFINSTYMTGILVPTNKFKRGVQTLYISYKSDSNPFTFSSQNRSQVTWRGLSERISMNGKTLHTNY